MAGYQLSSFRRSALLSGAALCAMTLTASASDLPATPEGAAALTQLYKTYIGADPAQSGLSISSEKSDYLVTFDLATLYAPLAKAGVKFDAAKIALKLFAQDDGAWRVERGDMPTIVWHARQNNITSDNAMALSGLNSSVVYDPAIGGARSGEFSADKVSLAMHQPNLDQNIDAGGLKGNIVGKAGPDGTYAATLHETIDSIGFAFAADPKIAEPRKIAEAKPVMVLGKTGAGAVDVQLDGWKTQPLLDLKAFTVAHPTPADLAANADALKALLTPIAVSQPSIAEKFASSAISIDGPQGKIGIGKATGAIGVSVKGPASEFEERIAVTGLELPAGMAPAMFRDLIPTAFDVGVKLTGFDLNAAAQEAVADMRVGGDGPLLDKDGNDKVTAKLLGAGPLLIEIPPSTLVAPQINIAFDGVVQYRKGSKPTGKFTVHMRDFDKTVSALKGLGPDAEQKYVPMFAMAKGLAKTEADGALSWVGELGSDGSMKVNGLPLGKSPF
jgi:hypothetical protein